MTIKSFRGIKEIAAKIRSDSFLLYLCFKDRRTPLSAKTISVIALALAFSPIDLIPDFIPVLGYLDDIIIIPLLIYTAFRLIPPVVISENKDLAAAMETSNPPVFRIAGLFIIILWVFILSVIIFRTFRYLELI